VTETLAMRAARYFGLHNKPRRSIHLGRHVVGIFAYDRLFIYDEAAYPNMAISVRLTERRRDALIEELERLRDLYLASHGTAGRP
jgi:hypothetical protein